MPHDDQPSEFEALLQQRLAAMIDRAGEQEEQLRRAITQIERKTRLAAKSVDGARTAEERAAYLVVMQNLATVRKTADEAVRELARYVVTVHGVSTNEVARAADVSQSTVSRWTSRR